MAAFIKPEPLIDIIINDGARTTNSKQVILKLSSGPDVKNVAISNSSDFADASQIPYQEEIEWNLCKEREDTCDDSSFEVFVKFYTKYGKSSEIISDTIILDTTPPEIKISDIKDYYREDEDIILEGSTEDDVKITFYWNEKYGLIQADSNGNFKINLGKMTAGKYIMKLTPEDLAGNRGQTLVANLEVKAVVVVVESTETDIPTKSTETILDKIDEVTDKITDTVEDVTETIEEITERVIDKIVDVITPTYKDPDETPTEVKEVVIVPEESPLVFKNRWYLLPKEAIKKFVLAPLPIEFQKLAEKFPKLEKTFKEVGVKKITDLKKLKSVNLILPGLTQRVGFSSDEIESGEIALPKAVSVAKLSTRIKEQIPTEIIFAKTGGELIDFNIVLNVSDKGRSQQRIKTISGKPLQLIVKPENPVKSIKGYLFFKSKITQAKSFKFSLESLTSSLIFASPIFAYSQEKSIETEEKLVLTDFEYDDFDDDGIYIAEINTPLVEGEYEIITVMDFEDTKMGRKEFRLIAVVDPEGYIYENVGGKELRIPNAVVSLYSLNPQNKKYELWSAKEYQQKNPQFTNNTGKYSFLVPEGFYYLKVEAPGYILYKSSPFEIKEDGGVHENIELKARYWFLKIIDWKIATLILVILLLVYNFYRDRKRENKMKYETQNIRHDI